MHIEFWWGSEKQRDHIQDQDTDGTVTLKWILKNTKAGRGLRKCTSSRLHKMREIH
jgi:hypothetical protein